MKYKYKHKPNRIYFITDFEDNEIVEFAYDCEKPSAKSQGYAYYRNKDGITKLCAKDDLILVETNYDKITSSVDALAEIMDNYRWCPYFLNSTCDSEIECLECIKEWLQKECDNGK